MLFRSICSARRECDYYATVFAWPAEKLGFVPFHTDPRFMDIPVTTPREGGYAIAAGRTFRDYETLIDAFSGLDVPLTIVGYRGPRAADDGPAEVSRVPANVTLIREMPLADLTRAIAGSAMVIVPLQDLQISIGQSVFLQAMAMKKPVVVTDRKSTRLNSSHT